MCLKDKGVKTRDCIDSAEDRGYWKDLVSAALYLQVSKPWIEVFTRNVGWHQS